jgi:hypothetical protein
MEGQLTNGKWLSSPGAVPSKDQKIGFGLGCKV